KAEEVRLVEVALALEQLFLRVAPPGPRHQEIADHRCIDPFRPNDPDPADDGAAVRLGFQRHRRGFRILIGLEGGEYPGGGIPLVPKSPGNRVSACLHGETVERIAYLEWQVQKNAFTQSSRQ